MEMEGGPGSALVFLAQWGLMMAIMMLPSATPAFLLYRTVRTKFASQGERGLPPAAFAALYLLVWTIVGVPVYAGYVAAAHLHLTGAAQAGAVAGVLALAGIYQLTQAKLRCLAACESPLSFFMARWRGGYGATSALAVRHALYCVGCCWALMLVLVAAGAMGIWWVTAIAVVVFLEKCLPRGDRTARVVGVALVLLGAAVLWRPGLADVLRR